MSFDKKFCIIIPTYNRNEVLKKNISILMDIIKKHSHTIKVIILDNASPIPVSITLSKLLSEHTEDELQIIRHKYNIGGNANIPLAFQYSDSDYVWVLSDDDIPAEDSINTIIRTINKNPECALYNFDSCEYGSKQDTSIITIGTHEFIKNMVPINKVMFISDCVWNSQIIGNNLRFAFFYQSTCAPILCALITSLGNDGRVVFSSEKLVKYGSEESPESTHFPLIPIALGLPSIRNLPLDSTSIKLLDSNIAKALKIWIKPHNIIHQLLLHAIKDNSWAETRITYNSLLKGIFSMKYTGFKYFALYLFKLSLFFPRTIKLSYPYVYKMIKKKKLKTQFSRDIRFL
ncbi:glycosyltransferase family 2 protein [Photorhabdus caribbeanensis]|uniref:glycosyltransferase family 2 protein n=1 Tax=Photorhabdus caribbeanensis TaxID=1004165 RepID=UPI001BD1F2EE|nr:glycosyltransferase [Photorhabdus caribbeanensis]MBS9423351.1 glycosyltransferase [Photorhabdus caribbeanensis]